MPARAQPVEDALPRAAVVSLPACEPSPIEWAPILSQLAIELGGMGVELELGGSDGTDAARLALTLPACDARTGAIHVSLANLRTGRAVEARVSIPTARRDHARVLALVIAELVRTRWPALTSNLDARLHALEEWRDAVDAVPEPELPSPVLEQLAMLERDRGRTEAALMRTREELRATNVRLSETEHVHERGVSSARIDAALAVWGYASGGIALAGPAVGIELPFDELRVRLDATTGFAEARASLGRVELTALTGGVGVLWEQRIDSLHLAVGAVARAGWAEARGEPADPTAFVGGRLDSVLWCVVGRASLRIPWLGPLGFFTAFELGYGDGVDARAGTQPAAATRGAIIGGALGLSLLP